METLALGKPFASSGPTVRRIDLRHQWSVRAQPSDLELRLGAFSKIVKGISCCLHPWAIVSPTRPAPAIRTCNDGLLPLDDPSTSDMIVL
jgi:hypothetical protein